MQTPASPPFHGKLPSGSTSPAPRITPYLPDVPNGLGLLVFPGGGYQGRAEHEGKGYAEWFAARGVACFVVEYRVGPDGFKHPAMLEDALAAMAVVREHAEAWGLRRLGVIGSSAGGHLAAMALTAYTRYGNPENLRPDFGILCYPVILTRGELAHAGSRNNLLGPNPSDELINAVSPAQHVDANTPPCFLWHSGEDTSVPMENSLAFAAALRKHGVPHALHLIPKGRHGLGLAADFPWAEEALRWMRGLDA
jgi:acetyl esterase/lipase